MDKSKQWMNNLLSRFEAPGELSADAEHPFYSLVPKQPVENLEFRRWLLKKGREKKDLREIIVSMCRRDLLFWVNAFCWGYDPRVRGSTAVQPFITWPKQDEWLDRVVKAFGHHDVVVRKPRDKGWSWIVVLAKYHSFNFSREPLSYMLVSRKAEYVDSKRKGSLFAKLRFTRKMQPEWLHCPLEETLMHWVNPQSDTAIHGEATVEALAVGDRLTAIMFDEAGKIASLAAMREQTADVTHCRIYVSTPYRGSVEFENICDAARDPERNIELIEPEWYDDPRKTAGLYRASDGTIRSSWLDREEKKRAPDDFRINVLGKPSGKDTDYYDRDMIRRLMTETAMDPFHTGVLRCDEKSGVPDRFVTGHGSCWLWMHLDAAGCMEKNRVFILGVDVARGTGSSNTILCAADVRTGEQVLEWADSRIGPRDAARRAVSVARWLNGALMIWESNGPGRDFGNGVLESGYGNIWYRTNSKKAGNLPTDFPGYETRKGYKDETLGVHRDMLMSGAFICRSRPALEECRCYQYDDHGIVDHVQNMAAVDPSGARAQHGDRPTAQALICWAMRDRWSPPILASPADDGYDSRIPLQDALAGEDGILTEGERWCTRVA